jgi:periplasmic mercuric ion binding protein
MTKLWTTLIAGLLSASAAWSAQQQTRIEVSELFCPSCPYIAADAVKTIESVQIVEADYDQEAEKIVFLISYDDALTTPEAIAEASMQYGYPGRVLAPESGS